MILYCSIYVYWIQQALSFWTYGYTISARLNARTKCVCNFIPMYSIRNTRRRRSIIIEFMPLSFFRVGHLSIYPYRRHNNSRVESTRAHKKLSRFESAPEHNVYARKSSFVNIFIKCWTHAVDWTYELDHDKINHILFIYYLIF